MGLIQKLKSALGLAGAQSPEPGTASPRDVDVTVEREPSSESEDAVKGTETAASGTAATDESDAEGAGADEPSQEESLIEEAESTDDEAGTDPAESDVTETGADDLDEAPAEDLDDDSTAEPAEDSTGEPGSAATDVPADPVTNINGIGPAYGERLSEAGVETVADLAAADPDELEAATDISAARIEGWIDAAAVY